MLGDFAGGQTARIESGFIELAAEEVPAAVAAGPGGGVAGAQEVIVLAGISDLALGLLPSGHTVDIDRLGAIGIGHRHVMPLPIVIGLSASRDDAGIDIAMPEEARTEL